MIEAVRYGLSHYADFRGRTPRATFWWWVLAVILVSIVVRILDVMLTGGFTDDPRAEPLSLILSLGLLIPNLAMSVRRLHDTGRSGWWLLLALIPLIGALILIYFYVQPSREPEAGGAGQPS